MHWASRDLLLVWQYERAGTQPALAALPPPPLPPHPHTVHACTTAAATSEQASKTVLLSITLIKCCAESAVASLGRGEGQSGRAGGHWETQIMARLERRLVVLGSAVLSVQNCIAGYSRK